MIDGDDVEFASLALPIGGGWFGLISLAIFLVVLVAYCVNEDECAQRTCANGSRPKLMAHECLCVESAR